MKLVFCLDSERGISFFGKRQSRDRYLCDDIVADCGGKGLEMSEYSAKIFAPHPVKITDTPDTGGSCTYFCELINPEAYINYADEVVIYHWNRHYPSDVKFNMDIESVGFSLASVSELVGYSHEKITKEVYKRI